MRKTYFSTKYRISAQNRIRPSRTIFVSGVRFMSAIVAQKNCSLNPYGTNLLLNHGLHSAIYIKPVNKSCQHRHRTFVTCDFEDTLKRKSRFRTLLSYLATSCMFSRAYERCLCNILCNKKTSQKTIRF